MMRQTPRSTLFPYTTLFRSGPLTEDDAVAIAMMNGIVTVEDVDSRMWDGNFEVEGADGSGNDMEITIRSEEHTSELQSRQYHVCCLLFEKKLALMLPPCNLL